MTPEDTKNFTKISKDEHAIANICLDKIRAIADTLTQLDENSQISDESGLRQHTVCNLAVTVLDEVERAEYALNSGSDVTDDSSKSGGE